MKEREGAGEGRKMQTGEILPYASRHRGSSEVWQEKKEEAEPDQKL